MNKDSVLKELAEAEYNKGSKVLVIEQKTTSDETVTTYIDVESMLEKD